MDADDEARRLLDDAAQGAERGRELQDSAAAHISRARAEEQSLRQRALALESDHRRLRASLSSSRPRLDPSLADKMEEELDRARCLLSDGDVGALLPSKPDASSAKRPPMAPRRSRVFNLGFVLSLLLIDAIVVALIIAYVPYTKIDWDAYMSQVNGFLAGERDYTRLKGDTGPLVYPAGFLYVYTAVKFVTSGEIYPAQILFGVLYVLNLGIIFFLYLKTNVLPWWAFVLLILSKRVHSIFMLRLFNDCFAMTILHLSLAFILLQKWHLALIIFSVAVSVKMNVLLYAPPLLLLMLKGMPIKGVFSALLGAAVVQLLLGFPFLLYHPFGYISRSFNLGRVFVHFWSVNFKFIPEPIFLSKPFAIFLLILHLGLLVVFAHYRWCRHEGGLHRFLHSKLTLEKAEFGSRFSQENLSQDTGLKILSEEHIATVMFVGNFIGVVCARSLHYQFYLWYFHSLPFLLWKVSFPNIVRLLLFAGVEICWNIYPSTFYSSICLLFMHLCILFGLWNAPSEHPYVDKRSVTKEE